jgi:hypothetical protein
MATTLRLPAELKAEADQYAASLGLSLNGLLAVALRDYLDGRRPAAVPAVQAPSSQPPAVAAETPAAPAFAIDPFRQPRGGPRAACACGSAKQWRHCHGRPGAIPGP